MRSWLRDAFRHAYPLDGRSLVDLALLHSDQALYVYVRTHHIVSDAWAWSYSSAGCAPATWAS